MRLLLSMLVLSCLSACIVWICWMEWERGAIDETSSDPTAGFAFEDEAAIWLRQSPLSDTALVRYAKGLMTQGSRPVEDTQVQALAGLALERNPRNVEAIALKLEADSATSNAESLIEQYDRLARVRPSKRDVFTDALVQLAAYPQLQRAITAKIASNAVWADEFFRKLVKKEGAGPGFADALLRDLQTRPPGTVSYDLRYLRNLVVAQAFNASRFRDAYDIWATGAEAFGAKETLVFNEQFEPLPIGSVFNWSTVSHTERYSEFLQDGGLTASSLTREAGLLTQQYVLLTPGESYELSVSGRNEGRSIGPKFFIQISCALKTTPIVEIDLPDQTGEGFEMSENFTLPDLACEAQSIRLYSHANDSLLRRRITLKALRIRPVS